MWRAVVQGEPSTKGSLTVFLKPRDPAFKGTTEWRRIQKLIKTRVLLIVAMESAGDKLKHWRKLIGQAGTKLLAGSGGWPTGPVQVEATITVHKPEAAVKEKREWPWMQGTGDADKQARAILDGLADAVLYGNDAQVCKLTILKCYPDTLGAYDRLDEPGAVLRVGPIEDEPVQLVLIRRSYEVAVSQSDSHVLLETAVPSHSDVGAPNVMSIYLEPAEALRVARALDHEAHQAMRPQDQEVLL